MNPHQNLSEKRDKFVPYLNLDHLKSICSEYRQSVVSEPNKESDIGAKDLQVTDENIANTIRSF